MCMLWYVCMGTLGRGGGECVWRVKAVRAHVRDGCGLHTESHGHTLLEGGGCVYGQTLFGVPTPVWCQ